MKRGKFIVLDGNDGSGKATQAKLLTKNLLNKGVDSVMMDFPAYDRNFFGAFIGECLAGQHGDFLHMDPKIASALYALDRMESSEDICTTLQEGRVVIADRFASSNQIHQGGKISGEQKRIIFLQWLDKMEHEILKIPRPDCIIHLRVPVEMSLRLLLEKRAAKNQALSAGVKDVVEEDRTYLEQSYKTANWLASQQPNWRVVECLSEEGMRSAEDIQNEVYAIAGDIIGK